METYKPGQGRLARLLSIVGLMFTLLLGCRELFYWIQSSKDTSLIPLEVGRQLPIFGVPFSWKFLLCLAIFCAGFYGILRLMSRPNTVNALIETESEMKKVSWPTFDESRNAALVVIVVTVVMTMALFVFDQVLSKVLRLFF